MAELRDNLLLDIDQALRQVRELENALNRALSELVIDVDVGPGVENLEDDLRGAARVSDEIADDTARIDRELKQADDSAEKLEREMRDVAKAADRAADETARIDREAKQAATSTGRLGGSLKALAVGAVAGIGLSQIADGLGAIIGAASETAESINAVNVVFGDAAQTILDFGEDTSDAVFLVASDFNALATTLGNLLQGFGLDVQTAADLTLTLTKRAADLASVFNTSVADALGAINSALQGQTEAIRRFTGSFSIDEVKRFGRELFDVTGELTDQQQALAAVEFILQKTSKVQGDAANTADELANQQRALNEVWGNAQGALGDALIPIMEDFLAILLDLVPAIEDAAPEFAEFVSGAVRGVSFIVNVTSSILNLGRGLTDLPRILTDDTRAFDQFAAAGRAAEGAIRDVTNASDEATTSLLFLGSGAGDVSGAQQMLEDDLDNVAAALGDLFRASQPVVSATGDLAGAQALLNDELANLEPWDRYAATLEEILGPQGDVTEAVSFTERAFNDAAEAVDKFREATLKLADPVFAAAAAQENLTSAVEDLADLGKDPETTLQDLANASLDVAKKTLEADAAARALGDISLVGGPFDRSIDIIGTALKFTRQEVLNLLEDALVLRDTDFGFEVAIVVDDDELARILAAIPERISILTAFDISALPASVTSGTRVGVAAPSQGPTVIFNYPLFGSDPLGDAADAANIISAITGATGQFVGSG